MTVRDNWVQVFIFGSLLLAFCADAIHSCWWLSRNAAKLSFVTVTSHCHASSHIRRLPITTNEPPMDGNTTPSTDRASSTASPPMDSHITRTASSGDLKFSVDGDDGSTQTLSSDDVDTYDQCSHLAELLGSPQKKSKCLEKYKSLVVWSTKSHLPRRSATTESRPAKRRKVRYGVIKPNRRVESSLQSIICIRSRWPIAIPVERHCIGRLFACFVTLVVAGRKATSWLTCRRMITDSVSLKICAVIILNSCTFRNLQVSIPHLATYFALVVTTLCNMRTLTLFTRRLPSLSKKRPRAFKVMIKVSMQCVRQS